MSKAVQPIPEGFHSLTAYLVVQDAGKAIDFYKCAFGAEEIYRLESPDTRRIVHAEIRIGDTPLMLSDEMEDRDQRSVEALRGSPVGFYFYVEDADQSFKRAIDAGAKQKSAPADMFWGDRCGSVLDPFGFQWTIGTRREEVTPEQISDRAKDFFAKSA